MSSAGNAVTAAVVVVLGAAAFTGALVMGAGSAAAPGPGTWPMLVGALLTALGAALLTRCRHTDDAEPFTRACLGVVAAVALMAGFAGLLGTIGFEIPAALLVLAWARFLGRESWLLSGLTALGTVAALYALFVGALDVPIPHLF